MNAFSIIMGAVLVEAVVNIVRNIQEKQNDWRYWASIGVGLVVGVIVAVNYGLDFFSLFGLEGQIPYVGAVLTGLILSRGANIVSDVLSLISRASR